MFEKKKFSKKGFSIVEVLLAGSLLALLFMIFWGSFSFSQESHLLAGQRYRALFLAEEGLEAARSIRDNNFADLIDGEHGISASSGNWEFSGTSDLVDGFFTRKVTVESLGDNKKIITSEISWKEGATRQGEVHLATYLNDWRALVGGAANNENFVLHFDSASVDPGNNLRVVNLGVENIGNQDDIVVERMDISWTGGASGNQISKIEVGNILIWDKNKNSGTVLDIDDFSLAPGETLPIDYLEFKKNITGANLSIIFYFSDGTEATYADIVL